MASPAPATRAVSDCGTRDLRMMFCHTCGSSPVCIRICQTDLRGMATEPNSRLSMKNRKTDATINSMNRVVGRFMPDYFISS